MTIPYCDTLVPSYRCEGYRKLEAERDRLRKALQFYAFRDWNDNFPGGICYLHNGETYIDTGEVAQEALKGT